MASHGSAFRKLNLSKDHRKSLLANLARSLVLHGRIQTTTQKAKELRPFVEKLVTKSINKKGVEVLHVYRQLISKIGDKVAAQTLMKRAESMKERKGGYTRIICLGFRKGDNASISIVEFVDRLEEESNARENLTTSKKKKEPVPG